MYNRCWSVSVTKRLHGNRFICVHILRADRQICRYSCVSHIIKNFVIKKWRRNAYDWDYVKLKWIKSISQHSRQWRMKNYDIFFLQEWMNLNHISNSAKEAVHTWMLYQMKQSIHPLWYEHTQTQNSSGHSIRPLFKWTVEVIRGKQCIIVTHIV